MSSGDCVIWGHTQPLGMPTPVTSFQVFHHPLPLIPLLCSHKSQDGKRWLTLPMSHWEFRVLSWTDWKFPLRRDGGLEKAHPWHHLECCPESTECDLAVSTSKWGVGNWFLPVITTWVKANLQNSLNSNYSAKVIKWPERWKHLIKLAGVEKKRKDTLNWMNTRVNTLPSLWSQVHDYVECIYRSQWDWSVTQLTEH